MTSPLSVLVRRSPIIERVARAGAVLIAVAALIDPAVSSSRATRPIVALLGTGGGRGDSLASARVTRALSSSFTLIHATSSNADATVLIGDAPPAPPAPDNPGARAAAPAFALFTDSNAAGVMLTAVRAPAWVPRDARASITIDARVTHARGRRVDLTLSRDGLVVDHATRVAATDDEPLSLSLDYVPTTTGPAALRVQAAVDGAPAPTPAPAAADLVLAVRDRQWRVLAYDPRPGWMSTFVRRALERDSRFLITSRMVTSRGVSVDAGRPPARLGDLSALAAFDAIVVSAPEALSDADVSALDAFLRRRGGSVVFLLDRRTAGPYERLVRVAAWSADSSGKAASITPVWSPVSEASAVSSASAASPASDSTGLRAAELAWPARLPDGAELVAGAAGRDSGTRPIVWQAPVGAGRLVVSGALDAWRFRDRATAHFDRFWQMLIASAASAAPPPIDVAVGRSVLAPGEETSVVVTLRDVALSALPAHASVSATLEATGPGAAPVPIRLWPDANMGQFRGTVRAGQPGLVQLVVSSGNARAVIPIRVMGGAAHATPVAHDLLAAWTAARGGEALSMSDVDRLPAALRAAIHPATRAETWHPMRSPWWIVPFALLLGGEWWLRRRRGLP